ncbi:hypothetical protein [Nonomuraea turcica]|uniref:hypothetical protein n=1 Tax=Nonomuraea sp. G32 TaxID=3067274 RepID=UPI00273B0102|nr:hypothetical protein [Nonomuraea sp. G32]MDP4509339.1 hypothetical protein [Nonomuraea sp. G32]
MTAIPSFQVPDSVLTEVVCLGRTRTSRLLVDRPAQHLVVHPDGRLFLAEDTVLTRL